MVRMNDRVPAMEGVTTIGGGRLLPFECFVAGVKGPQFLVDRFFPAPRAAGLDARVHKKEGGTGRGTQQQGNFGLVNHGRWIRTLKECWRA